MYSCPCFRCESSVSIPLIFSLLVMLIVYWSPVSWSCSAALTENQNNTCSMLLTCLAIPLYCIAIFSRHIFKCSLPVGIVVYASVEVFKSPILRAFIVCWQIVPYVDYVFSPSVPYVKFFSPVVLQLSKCFEVYLFAMKFPTVQYSMHRYI